MFKFYKIILLTQFLLLASGAFSQTVYTVTKTADPPAFDVVANIADPTVNKYVEGTLQWAIRKANNTSGPVTIDFNIPGPSPYVITVNPVNGSLPSIVNEVFMDGTSQPGYSSTSNPVIHISGGNHPDVVKLLQISGTVITAGSNSKINGVLFKDLAATKVLSAALLCRGDNVQIIDNMFHNIGTPVPGYNVRIKYALMIRNCENVLVEGNYFGTDITETNTSVGNLRAIEAVASRYHTIGGTYPTANNIIANNGSAIDMFDNAFSNLITQNKIYDNGIDINLVYNQPSRSGNKGKLPPVISSVTYGSGTAGAFGTSDPGDIVEVFLSNGPGNALEYLGSTFADQYGAWSINSLTLTNGQGVITTGTDNANNTSEFSNYLESSSDCPQAYFSHPPDICFGDAVTFTDMSISVPPGSIYEWDFGDGNTSTAQNPTHTYITPGDYTVTLQITSYDYCPVAVYSSTVSVFSVSFEADYGCTGQSLQFTNTSTGNLTGATYEWDFGDGHFSTAENPSHIYQTSGSYDVILTVNPNNGCPPTSQTESVVIFDAPDPTFTHTTPVVTGQAVQFTANDQSADDYSWDFGDGNSGTGSTASNTYTTAGAYTVVLNISNDYYDDTGQNLLTTCSNSYSVTINVIDCDADPDFEASTVCFGESTAFTDLSTGDLTDASYLWEFGDGNISTKQNPAHTYASPGTYSATLTITQSGCNPVSVTYNVTVLPLPDASFTFIPSNPSLGAPIDFTATNTAADNYFWDFGDGNTAAGSSVTHTYTTADNYMVVLQTQKNHTIDGITYTCTNTEVQMIYFCTNAEFDIDSESDSPGDLVYCNGAFLLFNNLSAGVQSGDSYLWDFGDGTTSTDENPPPHQYSQPGTYTVSLTINLAGTANEDCYSESGYSLVYELNITIQHCFNCDDECIGSFAPEPGNEYVLSAWVKEDGGQTLITYNSPQIFLVFLDNFGNTVGTLGPYKGKGRIIDGWQRIEEPFTIPAAAEKMKVQLKNAGTSNVFFDDIRFHPFKAALKSFVYDPVTLRLTAELDENNYATFYEYDEEGKLIRVKKETERGIKTIQESRNNTFKDQ